MTVNGVLCACRFKEQIYDVYRYLPPETQVVLISATLPHEVLEMTHKFMTDPVRVLVKRDELTLEVSAKCCLPFWKRFGQHMN